MPISRKDLADAGSPEALVKRVLQAEPMRSRDKELGAKQPDTAISTPER